MFPAWKFHFGARYAEARVFEVRSSSSRNKRSKREYCLTISVELKTLDFICCFLHMSMQEIQGRQLYTFHTKKEVTNIKV